MEEGESVLEAIYEDDDNLEDAEDVQMVDVEEGECVVEAGMQIGLGQSSTKGVDAVNHAPLSKNCSLRANKRKKKRKRSYLGPNVMDINRFVLDTCRHLKEKKSYMVWTAVGCLGVSALSDLVKEVDAVQACGGQMTANGMRLRTGGGILWNIIKAREPNAYKEIMKRAKEIEKQCKQQNSRQAPERKKETNGMPVSISNSFQVVPQLLKEDGESSADGKRVPVKDRIRVAVSYDDLLGEDPKDLPNKSYLYGSASISCTDERCKC